MIHRHPYEVHVSGMHTVRVTMPVSTLQRPDVAEQNRRTGNAFRCLLDAYFEDRHRIPAGRLVEIGFQQLEQSPLSTLRHVYERLALPEFAVAEPAVAEYLSSIEGYRRNKFAEIDSATKLRLQQEWRRCFEEWGYAE
jgi:hypothetical protein